MLFYFVSLVTKTHIVVVEYVIIMSRPNPFILLVLLSRRTFDNPAIYVSTFSKLSTFDRAVNKMGGTSEFNHILCLLNCARWLNLFSAQVLRESAQL